jgi:deoxycytidine triphosphate deaminase
MLSDQDIVSELQTSSLAGSTTRLIDHFPREGTIDWSALPLSDPQWTKSDSPIQPASIDLHVGRIYIPGSRPGSLGAEGRGALSHVLRPGQSVVVSTYERISLPASLGGIVFPPSKLSSSGILVANIGHIDPGFEGQLRFTIINMGGSDYPLERGTVAVGTLLLFRLSSQSRTSWSARHGVTVPKGEPDKAEIDSLARDFADIESRTGQIAKKAVKRLQWRFSLWAVLVPMLLGIALANWAIWFETGRFLGDRIERDDQGIYDLRDRLARVEAAAEPRAAELDRELARIRSDLETAKRDLSDLRSRFGSRPDTGRR